jgi:hypothetical protein
MGLISFIKNTGASIFGGSEAKAAPAEELKKELDKHGLDSKDVKKPILIRSIRGRCCASRR